MTRKPKHTTRTLPPPSLSTRARSDAARTKKLAELYHDLQVHQEEVHIQNQQLIESQRLLEDSRNRYLDLYDFAPIAVITLCDAGVIREANLTAASLVGAARASLLETPFVTLVAPPYRRVFLEHLRRCRQSGRPVTSELDLRTRDGRIVPISLSSNAGTNWPNHVRPGLRYHSAIIDLTERRAADLARAQLRQVTQSEQLVRTVIDTLPVGVRVIDPAGGMIIQNIASSHIWGNQTQGVAWLGGRATRVGEHSQLPEQDWPLARALRGQTVIEEILELRPDAHPRDLRIVKQAAVPLISDDGSMLGAVAVSEDVTQLWHTQTELRRAKREAELASRLKDDFLTTISHELRTPLSAVLLWSHLLRTAAPADLQRQHEAVEAIYINAKAQSQIIEDLLDLSRMTTGKFKISPRPAELTPVVREAIESVQPASQAKGIQIDLEVVRDPGQLRLDPDRMRQVVWNLLSNAIKFTPEGGSVHVLLDMTPTHARLVVADTGAGIPAEFLPNVFDRFRQADSSTTREQGGLGLGLSIVKQLVELHGGAVKVASPGLGMGSTFTVELPLRERAGDKASKLDLMGAAEPEKPADTGPVLEGTRILLVEDEPLSRRAISRLLEQSGAQVTSCSSVSTALEALEKDPPDILLSDLSMPGEDGLELIRKIRRREAQAAREQKHSPEPHEPRQSRKRSKRSDNGMGAGNRRAGSNGAHSPPAHLPAAALTARAMPHDRAAALQAGFEAYIAKPVDAAQLVDLVRGLVRTGRMGRAPQLSNP